jgi:hypothetical protein
MRWHCWLRHYATIPKASGSISGGVIGIFHWHNSSGRTLALGSTQPLKRMTIGTFSGGGGKGGRCVGLTTLPHSCAGCLEIWVPQPPVTLRACTGNSLCIPIYAIYYRYIYIYIYVCVCVCMCVCMCVCVCVSVSVSFRSQAFTNINISTFYTQ